MKVVVINFGMGNLGSVRRALEECGGQVNVSESPDDLLEAERIVLPGVGAFAEGIERLRSGGWPEMLSRSLQNRRVALLGICLGMQLLAERGSEGGRCPGLGLIPGDVRRLAADAPSVRIPHVGWNEIEVHTAQPLLRGIPSGSDFYFVHSFHVAVANPSLVAATTPYCSGFVSVVQAQNVFGTQFHPEKSSRSGFKLLRNFLDASLLGT